MDRTTYMALIEPAAKIVVNKHQDYNTGVTLDQYFPFGDKSYVQMLNTKALRLVSLANKDGAAIFESRKDTVLDMINYCVFYLAYLERQ